MKVKQRATFWEFHYELTICKYYNYRPKQLPFATVQVHVFANI